MTPDSYLHKDRRDLRDPEKLGQMLLTLTRVQKVPILQAADELPGFHVPNTVDVSAVERYGRPDEVQPLWMEVQVR